MKTGVIYAKCQKTKERFGVSLQEHSERGWSVIRAYPLGKTASLYKDEEELSLDGPLVMSRHYNNCPFCQNSKLVECGSCGKFTCYDGQSESFTCAFCSKTSKIVGKIDGFKAGGGQ